MDKNIAKLNLSRALKMAASLEEAKIILQQDFPLNVKNFTPENLEPQKRLYIDGFRARFSDLQDYLGDKLFKTITYLDMDETQAKHLSTLERISLVDKKEIVSEKEWNLLRTIRNNFTHDYPDLHEIKAVHLNDAFDNVDELLNIVVNIKKYLKIKHEIE